MRWMGLAVIITGAVVVGCSDGRSAQDDVSHRLDAFRNATFTVAYELVVDGPEVDHNVSRLVWYQDAGRTRMDYYATEGPSKAVITEGAAYQCDHTHLGSPGGCGRLAAGSLPLLPRPVGDLWNAIYRASDLAIPAAGDRTVLGEEAACFSPRPLETSSAADLELCLSGRGLLLYGSATYSDPTHDARLTATGISREIPDGTFDPPFTAADEP